MAKAKEGRDDKLEALLQQFCESQDQTQTAREQSERDRDFYDGIQWTAEEIEALQARKQPVVTSNRIKPKIDSLIGFEKRQRTDPKAFPRTPKHDHDAEAATDALRFVCDTNSFQQVRSGVAENLFIEGYGAATVGMVKRKNGDLDIKITDVPWDRFYFDPHSRRRDFSDASYKGVVVWMDEADALNEFKGKADVIESCYSDGDDDGDSFSDRPKVVWSDRQRKRIRVLQHRWKDKGVWSTAIICRGGYLRDPQPSPYLDEWGDPECDLIAVSAYVNRENERYGVVRQMISAQEEINKRRSKALHRLSVRQVIAQHGAVEDVAAAKRELAKPDGYIEVNGDMRFELTDSVTLAAPELEMLREAKAEIDASGVNPSLEGEQDAPSGRAQEIQQASALSEMAVVFDALKDWSWRIYKASWNRVRQYWTDEKWVRVTDDERNVRFVGLNHPVTAEEEAQRFAEEGQPVPPELQQLLTYDPQAVVRVENPVAELDVDIIVEDGPDSVTVQAEQFQQLVELKKADPAAIPTEMVIEASNLRNKDRILEHLEKGGIPPQVQQQMQEMQQALQECQQQLQQAEQAKGVEKQEAQAIKAQVSADIKVAQSDLAKERAEMQLAHAQWELAQMTRGADMQIKAYEAETDRMQALKPEPEKETLPE